MKNVILMLVICLLIALPTFAQVLDDYVSEVKDNILVIKTYDEIGEESALVNAVELDTEAPADRVYELQADGWYPLGRALSTPARTVRIVGDFDDIISTSDSESWPPLISGYVGETATANGNLLQWGGDLEVENVIMETAADDGSFGWTFLFDAAPNCSVTLNNCLFEHTKWVYFQSNGSAGTSFYVTNCYFVNAVGHDCRRNGGVYDNVSHDTELMMVENCTHVNLQGMVYKFRNYPVTKAFFNHNTFVNCSGQIFETLGYQNEWSVTNNLFVNSNVQPYRAGLDKGETDVDLLPMGIINVRPFPTDTAGSFYEGLTEAGRKILVDGNGLYWDSRLSDLVDQANADGGVNGFTNWVSQMITMNTRTQDMFDDDATYPLLTEDNWIEGGDPNFTDPADLMTDAVDDLKTFSLATLDTNSTQSLPMWRTEDNPATVDNWIYPDFPIPVDLSYTNATYLTAAYNDLPLGDLNWFPTQKATWEAQRDAEHAAIDAALDSGQPLLGINDRRVDIPAQIRLSQNYPNPFNPETNINYTIPQAGKVTLKIYNAKGQEVSTLIDNEYKDAMTHNVDFDGSKLPSGIYIYTLTVNNYKVSKKMILVK
jgi:hypothetical protein